MELHIVLDNIRSAFNVGSIFRTADACAVDRVWLCGMTAFPPNPRLARTALGAEESVPWTRCAGTGEAFDRLEAAGAALIAVEVAPGAVAHVDYAWPERAALVFGHETSGIAPALLARCAGVVAIPMYGHKNSLNVATAAGVVMYEVLRRRGRLARPPEGPQSGFLEP